MLVWTFDPAAAKALAKYQEIIAESDGPPPKKQRRLAKIYSFSLPSEKIPAFAWLLGVIQQLGGISVVSTPVLQALAVTAYRNTWTGRRRRRRRHRHHQDVLPDQPADDLATEDFVRLKEVPLFRCRLHVLARPVGCEVTLEHEGGSKDLCYQFFMFLQAEASTATKIPD